MEQTIQELQNAVDNLQKQLAKIDQSRPLPEQSPESYSSVLRALGISPEAAKTAKKPGPELPKLLSRPAAVDLLHERFNQAIDKKILKNKLQYAVRTGKMKVYNEDGSERTAASNKKSFLRTADVLDYAKFIV